MGQEIFYASITQDGQVMTTSNICREDFLKLWFCQISDVRIISKEEYDKIVNNAEAV